MTKRVSKADKFATLFDQDWAHTKSRIRERIDSNQRAYDLTNSWDARSDNPASFSRLDQTLVPYQPSAPIVLSGTAVVKLEKNQGFNAINVKQPDRTVSAVPLTVEQHDVGMASDYSAHVPAYERARSANKVLVVEKPTGYENQGLQAPRVKEAAIPDFLQEAGPQTDQRLLHPKQRREIMEFEKKKLEAELLLKKAQMDRNKVRGQLASQQYHRGALMIDSSDNVNSEIYGGKAKKELSEQEYKRQIHLERRSRLSMMNSSITTNGNLLVPDTIGPRVQLEKFYQSKGGHYHALSFDETHNRLFCRLQGALRSDRTQLLRDIDLSGKDYNITQHTVLEHWPPREFHRQVERNMTHPSQNSLEGTRNLQGSMRPF